jgi:STE24 endopeptidase
LANEDKAARYHRLRRRASVAGAALGVLLLFVLLVTGGSATLRASADSLTGGSFLLSAFVYVVALVLMSEALRLPLALYTEFALERRFGLSRQTPRMWWLDQLKGLVVAVGFGVAAALIVVSLLRWSPTTWWLWAAACFSGLLIGLAQLAPVVLLPIFYDFKPLERATLEDRLTALADRAGTPVLGVFEWRLSDRTRKANAALAGIRGTRRILLSDTLLAEHSDDEIEVILAHELAHHVYRDIWTGIALEASLILAAFFVADVALERFAESFALTGKDDIAGLPLILLAGGIVSLVLRPAFNACSRSHERRADRYALDTTRNVTAFVSAMKRLAAQNMAEERPSRLVEVLFHTHPPTDARIAAAEAWAVENTQGT